MKETKLLKCCKCNSDYEDEFYIYQDNIYCFSCLIEELEESQKIHIGAITHYYNEDFKELGTSDDINTAIQNICEEYEIEVLEC